MDDVLVLISQTFEKDSYGVDKPSETSRKVFCKAKSVSRREFYDGGRNGLNPEFEFDIFLGDYNGETVCEFHGKRYAIYRTYISANQDYIELYVERKGGTNGS